jgi:predicted phosphate transport protein (TIGR00153 family)
MAKEVVFMSNDSFLGMFAKSPFSSLQEHMDVGKRAAIELQNFLNSAKKSDWDAASQYRQKIIELEHAADGIKNKIRSNLPKFLFMSVSREDLLDLVYAMDGIPNTAKDISGIMIGRHMEIPEQVSDQFISFSNAVIKASEQASAAIEKVDEIQKSGFGSRDAVLLQELVAELEQLEQEDDELEAALRNDFFLIEKGFPPVDVMFFYDIINRIGSLADISQTVGHILIRLVSK